MSKKEGRMSGELFEMQMNTRAMAFNDIDSLYNTGSRIEAGMRKMTGAFFLINLMTPWNQMIKTHQTMLIASRIIEECDNFVKGTITGIDNAAPFFSSWWKALRTNAEGVVDSNIDGKELESFK